MKINITHNESECKFTACLPDSGTEVAFLQYALRCGTTKPTIDMYHTWTEPGYRGKGLAEAVTLVAFRHASDAEWQVQPSCSYIRDYWLTKHPQFQSVCVLGSVGPAAAEPVAHGSPAASASAELRSDKPALPQEHHMFELAYGQYLTRLGLAAHAAADLHMATAMLAGTDLADRPLLSRAAVLLYNRARELDAGLAPCTVPGEKRGRGGEPASAVATSRPAAFTADQCRQLSSAMLRRCAELSDDTAWINPGNEPAIQSLTTAGYDCGVRLATPAAE